MAYIEQSEAICGYKVKIVHRGPVKIAGFTRIIPPRGDELVGRFWDEVSADGRLDGLKSASSAPVWVLGLGSWDPECQKGGFRYTICIEETEGVDFSALERAYPLYRAVIDETDWMQFEMTVEAHRSRFWHDNPYKMMKPLGYAFNTGGFNTGLHFDAYPPGFAGTPEARMEFWITVKKAGA